MSLILAAHGTRRADGVAMIGDIAAQVSSLVDRRVQVAFVDVLGPTPSESLTSLAWEAKGVVDPAIVVPAFLSRGYHVRTDLPAHVAASGHRVRGLGACRDESMRTDVTELMHAAHPRRHDPFFEHAMTR